MDTITTVLAGDINIYLSKFDNENNEVSYYFIVQSLFIIYKNSRKGQAMYVNDVPNKV